MAFHVLDDMSAIPAALRGAVVAIGNFDGLHRGHQSVFELALDQARSLGAPGMMLTFEPHPRDLFAPEPFMYRLTNGETKARLAEAIGFDGIVVMPFTREFAAVTAERFVSDHLVGALGIKAAIAGADFMFGRARLGTPDYLKQAGAENGFAVTIADMLDEGDAPVSSSRVREALSEGRVRHANNLLGYHHLVVGRVVHGDKRGRTLGYPTANIPQSLRCGLKHGVYAIRVRHAGKLYDGVASYGRRLMFDNGEALFEAHLFDFDGDLYGSHLEIALVDWQRGEEKFNAVEELIAQMDRDSEIARDLLASEKAVSELDERLGFFTA